MKIDLSTPNEWQHRDPETGLLFPWYTKSFLDELATWDLKGKHVLEFGMGASTLWWQKKAAYVTAFDSNREWYNAVVMAMDDRSGDEGWVESISEIEDQLMEFYHIAIVDIDPVEWRDECIRLALSSLHPGGILIIDNWDQPSVWVPSDETRELLAPYEMKVYNQEGHPDWQTATFKIV